MLSIEPCSSTSESTHAYSSSISSAHSAGIFSSASSRSSSAISGSSASNTQSLSANRTRARRSLSVLNILPKDISALIRSHSTSSRRQPTSVTQRYHNQATYAGDMVKDDDRPSRKPKSENKLYQFITRSLTRSRSRSRSRSRNGRDTPPPIDPNEPIPDLPSSRVRIDSMGQSTPSKPATRIQSRPLSSTTTATNTTITPGTPRPKKRPPSGLPIPIASNHADSSSPSSRPTTPKPSTTRKKLHTLFGIPLSSPKKSSFNSSRPSSRRSSSDALPPLPRYENDENDNDPTPKALKSYPIRPYSRPASPSPDPQLRPNHETSTSSTTNSSGSSRLQRFFTGHRTPPPSTDAVSGPIRKPSGSSHRRRNSATSPATPSLDAPSPTPVPKRMMSPSRTATAQAKNPRRPGTAPQMAVPSSVGHSSRKSSAESGPSVEVGDSVGSMNGHVRMKMQAPGRSQRSTKHGSFDFERPGWSTGAIQRSGSGGTTGTGTSTGTSLSGWGRGHDGTAIIRDSAMGPGLAGVGTLQRDASVKRAKERDEMVNRIREEELRRRKAESRAAKERMAERDLGILHENTQPSPRTLSPDETRATSTSTVKSSSWGRKRGTLLGNGGKGKMASLGLSHGPFAFEPAVPSPTRSTESVGAGHDKTLTVSWAGDKSKGKSRSKAEVEKEKEKEKERRKSREKERRSQSAHRGDRAPVPVPNASVGHRSGTKGRSLDLGLGLAWAPSSMRENAVMPSSGFLGRSLSGSSSLGGRSFGTSGGRSISNSTNGHSTIEEERSILGNHVAEVFKNALDDAGYKAFKRYVHLFDTHDIPFDGPTGIVSRVERLLMTAPALSDEGKRQLLDNFVRVVLQHA